MFSQEYVDMMAAHAADEREKNVRWEIFFERNHFDRQGAF